MERFAIDLQALAAGDVDVETMAQALETEAAEGDTAAPALWTEQFAASGKIGKGSHA